MLHRRLRPLALPLLALSPLAQRAGADTLTLAPVADGSIYAESPSNSNGGGSSLHSGANSGGNARRALIRFDVAGALPAGAQVLSARLEIHCAQISAGPSTIALHRLLASWGEGTVVAPGAGGQGAPANPGDATWSHRFLGSLPWTTPGGDFDAAASGSVLVPDVGSYAIESAGTRADVQAWLDAPASEHGWILLGEEAAFGSAKRFDSREATNAALRPRLVVEFEPGAASCTDFDGAFALCPCGNAGAPGHGCDNPQGTGGVRLSATAFAPDGAGGGTVTLLGEGFPAATAPGVVALRSSAAAPIPFQDGVLCILSPTAVRVAGGHAAAGALQLPLVHAAGSGAFTYQLWYRSLPAAYCTPAAANVSSAYTLLW